MVTGSSLASAGGAGAFSFGVGEVVPVAGWAGGASERGETSVAGVVLVGFAAPPCPDVCCRLLAGPLSWLLGLRLRCGCGSAGALLRSRSRRRGVVGFEPEPEVVGSAPLASPRARKNSHQARSTLFGSC